MSIDDWLDNMDAETRALNEAALKPRSARAKRPRSKRTSRAVSEHTEQVKLCTFARMKAQEQGFTELALLFAIPNGGQRHKAVAGKMKAEGVRPGVPDLFLPVARGGFHGLFVEMKTLKGRVQPVQVEWHKVLEAQGFCVKVCYGYNAAVVTLCSYMQNDITYLRPHEESTT